MLPCKTALTGVLHARCRSAIAAAPAATQAYPPNPGSRPRATLQFANRKDLRLLGEVLYPVPQAPAPSRYGSTRGHRISQFSGNRAPCIGLYPEPGAGGPPLPVQGSPEYQSAMA